jgi:hypothetical protein
VSARRLPGQWAQGPWQQLPRALLPALQEQAHLLAAVRSRLVQRWGQASSWQLALQPARQLRALRQALRLRQSSVPLRRKVQQNTEA